MSQPDDEQLAERAQRGDATAFDRLVDRYQERLLRFLQTRCRSRADAEDALQDALLDAWRYLHSYDARWRFSTWLYRIAIRRAARTVHAPPADREDAADPRADPLAECVRASERQNLWLTARRVLPADACTALWLHYVEDMAQKDVARALQRSLPWTKVTLMRARRRLQTELDNATIDDRKGQAYG
ncbi:MAG: sigma-70 family RNA polymerase sigma factor [Woeseiaceae bacterium]|nr:sigma-70 family RNA polymerase sigma factor [Woeseiaceae bacterium]